MKVTNALVTYTDLSTMGLVAKGTPATGTRIATKEFVTANYYVDEAASPFAGYTSLRCPPYQTIIAGTPPYSSHYLTVSYTAGSTACSAYSDPTNRVLFYTVYGATITTGTILYTTSDLTTPVANGFYSNGVDYWNTAAGAGNLQNQTSCTPTTTTTTTTAAPPPTTTTTTTPTPPTTTTTTTTSTPTTTTTTTIAFTSFSLTYSSTAGSTACADYAAPTNRNFYYAASGATLTTGTILYTTSSLTIPVANGFYSNGVDYWNTAASVGNLQNQTSCTPPTTTTTTTTIPITTTTTTTTTAPSGYTIDWSFSQQAQSGDFSISVNGIQVVYTTVSNSGQITVPGGAYVGTGVGAGAQSLLTAEACLTVADGATTLYNNCSQGYPNAGENYPFYYPSDNGSISATSYEF